MRSRLPSSAIVFVMASGSAVTACGSEEMFVPELASNERLIEREAVARLGIDDGGIGQLVVVGDLDGDGIDDAIISSVYNVPGQDVQGSTVYVLYGGATVTGEIGLSTLPSLTGGVFARFSFVGDVDGDGLADLLAEVLDGAYLVYGRSQRLTGATPIADAGVFLRDADPNGFPGSVMGLGDLDGDGRADFGIGRPAEYSGDCSEVFLFYGRRERLSGTLDLASTADAVISEPMSSWAVRPDLVRAGDVDGDGYGDFIVDLPIGPFATDVRLVRGGATRLTGTVAADAIARTRFVDHSRCLWLDGLGGPLGDLDGDGFDDFALTSCQDVNGGPGQSPTVQRVFYGRPAGFPAQVGLGDEDATLHLTKGTASRIAGGDVDGDGVRDLIVSDVALRDANGGVHVIKGNGVRLSGDLDLGPLGTTYVGMPQRGTRCKYLHSPDCITHEWLGTDLGVADLTGDRRVDILIGAPTDEFDTAVLGVHGSGLGHAYLVSPSVGAKP